MDNMKAFLQGLPYLWSEMKFWDVKASLLPIDFIQPFMNEFNKQRCKVSIAKMIISHC
jgi:hypothetical protein